MGKAIVMFELQVKRNGVWESVYSGNHSMIAYANANMYYRENRRRRSVRVMRGVQQVLWMPARSR